MQRPLQAETQAFLWASLLMVLSSFAAYLIMKRIGILR
jgi:Mg2+ and Co2+ transporter CorA